MAANKAIRITLFIWNSGVKMLRITRSNPFKQRLKDPAAYQVRNSKTQNHSYNKPDSVVPFDLENEYHKQNVQWYPRIRIAKQGHNIV